MAENHPAKPARAKRELVTQIFVSWNQVAEWLARLNGVRLAE